MENINFREYSSENTIKYRDVVSVQYDLQNVVRQLEQHLKLPKQKETEIIRLALWNSAIVTFMKCFASGVRQYKISSSIFERLPGEPMRFYDFIKNLRDKHIAHSVSMCEEHLVGVVVNEGGLKSGIGHFSIIRVGEPDRTVQQVVMMAKLALTEASDELKRLQKVIDEELSQFDKADMLKWPILKYVVPDVEKAASKARKQTP